MKALIVDDEPLARSELRRLLADFDWVEIVGEAGNIGEAQQAVDTLAPELLFLDIQMPGGSGFDLLTRLKDVPRVIFTSVRSSRGACLRSECAGLSSEAHRA